MLEATGFSKRIIDHALIEHEGGEDSPLVLAVRDQVLICSELAAEMRSLVDEWIRRHRARPLGSFLRGMNLRETPPEDVLLYEIDVPKNGSVFSAVRELREQLPAHSRHRISPNHVLVPASEAHSCPKGPPIKPGPHLPPIAVPDVAFPRPRVTVIDSGWIWKDEWPPNPLAARGIKVVEAERLVNGDWVPDIPDELDVGTPGVLDALAGHANFVTGVVAIGCANADITVRNHNGGYAPDAVNFATEAAVARSLVRSFVEDAADVVNLGFAFAALQDEFSCVWEIAFGFRPAGTIVVAPAGNQTSTGIRFPAGLNHSQQQKDPTDERFAYMVGVGSFHENIAPMDAAREAIMTEPSDFSNYGDWVASSTVGEKVVSTFLWVDMPPEDDPNRQPVDFQGWAEWNGTSFAAPRIAADIAGELMIRSAADATTAWDAMLASGRKDANLGRMVTIP